MRFNNVQQGQSCPICKPNRVEKTCLKKYGVKNVFENAGIKEKIEQTNFSKYGFKSASKNEEIKQKSKQTCMIVYGVDNPKKNERVKEKGRVTSLKNFGVDHHMKNRDIARKCAQNSKRSSFVKYWLNNKFLTCQSSYEEAFVAWINKNHFHIDWQPGPFLMPDGHTYTPDAFLHELRIFIEIKGYPRKRDMEKYSWFHKTYPNSELWTKEVLKTKGIL